MLHQLLSLNPNGINSEFYEKETNMTHNLLVIELLGKLRKKVNLLKK